MVNVLLLCDNNELQEYVESEILGHESHSSHNVTLLRSDEIDVTGINLATESIEFTEMLASVASARQIDVLVSLHCQAIIPSRVIENIRCINVHPGYLPRGRGWFPHVYSILHGETPGVTIHEMTSAIDRGPVIVKKSVEMNGSDTSYTLYRRIIKAEKQLLREHWISLIEGNYKTNVNTEHYPLRTKAEYSRLCQIDLDTCETRQNFLNLLRATTHPPFNNAVVQLGGEKYYIEIKLTPCEEE